MVVIVDEQGQPLFHPNVYATLNYRDIGASPFTIEKILRSLGMVYLWSSARSLDLDHSLISGDFPSMEQMEDLALFLRMDRKSQDQESAPPVAKKTSKIVRLEHVRGGFEGNQPNHSQISAVEGGARIRVAANYFEFHLERRLAAMRHDYSLTPCPKDKDCQNCGEHAFVKGDERHYKEAFYQYYILQKALENAYTAQSNGESGASRWIKQNAPKLERWRKALELMADSSIPNGTLISPPPPDHSQSKTGLSEAVKLVNFGPVTEVGIEDESDEQALLDLEFF